MIITCDQCDKRFEIESNLIPQKGRLLQCSSCSHKSIYKKDEQEETAIVLEDQDVTKPKNKPIFNENRNVKFFNNLKSSHKIKRKHSYANLEIKKISFLNVILIFIISSIGLIILLDTFKSPISLMIPNIEFILENLYETLKDILLFIQDLF